MGLTDPEAVARLNACTQEISAGLRDTAGAMLRTGSACLLARELVGPVAFMRYLAVHFSGASVSTLERWMLVARCREQLGPLEAYQPTTLYRLTAPSIPADAREEARARALAGETITARKAEEIVGKRKAARRAARQPGVATPPPTGALPLWLDNHIGGWLDAALGTPPKLGRRPRRLPPLGYSPASRRLHGEHGSGTLDLEVPAGYLLPLYTAEGRLARLCALALDAPVPCTLIVGDEARPAGVPRGDGVAVIVPRADDLVARWHELGDRVDVYAVPEDAAIGEVTSRYAHVLRAVGEGWLWTYGGNPFDPPAGELWPQGTLQVLLAASVPAAVPEAMPDSVPAAVSGEVPASVPEEVPDS